MLGRIGLAAVLLASSASAQDLRDTATIKPIQGMAARASVGSDVYTRVVTTTRWEPVAMLSTDLDLMVTKDRRLAVSATTPLIPDALFTPPSLVACTASGGYFSQSGEEQACFADPENNGTFDRAGGSGSFFRKKVAPIPYRMTSTAGAVVKTFQQTLIFAGLDGKTLRLSYREFTDDMARPAFTQELTFTMSGKYPEAVSFRDVTITVLGIDNSGMRYTIDPAAK